MLRWITFILLLGLVVYCSLYAWQSSTDIIRANAKPIPGWSEEYRGLSVEQYLLKQGLSVEESMSEDSIDTDSLR